MKTSYRFKTKEEFEATCMKDQSGDFHVGGVYFVPSIMSHLYGQPIEISFDMDVQDRPWTDANGETWLVTREMLIAVRSAATVTSYPTGDQSFVHSEPLIECFNAKYNIQYRKAHRPVRIGDFILLDFDSLQEKTLNYHSKTDSFLVCLIAQTGSGVLQLISVSASSANRTSDKPVEWQRPGSSINALSDEVINELTEGAKWELIETDIVIKLLK